MARLWQLKYWGLIAALIGFAIPLAVILNDAVKPAGTLEAWHQQYTSWYPSSLEVEFWRTLEAANRYVDGDPDVDRPGLDQRINVLLSRLAVFDGGLAGARMHQIPGAGEVIQGLERMLEVQEPALRSLRRGDLAQFGAIRKAFAPIGTSLRDVTAQFQQFESHDAEAAGRTLRSDVVLGAVLIVGLLLTGIVLVGFLVVEIGVRRRLLTSVLASQEQARRAQAHEEAALVEFGRRFHAIATANPVAVVVCETERGRIRYANTSAVALLGLSGPGPVDAALGDFFVDHAALRTAMSADENGTDQLETRLRRSGGDEFPASFSARALEHDRAPAVVVGIVDQTEKEAARLEIERQREIIHHGEKLGALGSLLAGVAHELNNPLSIVVAQATLLEELTTDSDTAVRGERIRAAAERCARIVKTFLAMARQRPPSRAAVNLTEVVEAALELLGYGLQTAGIDIQRDFAASLPEIWADPDQVSQVITNLIVNAQQALSDWPGPRRLIIATRFDAGDGMVRIAVSDSGPGVPADIKSRIFEPFFTTKPLGVGTGIGLSVCHSIVTSHGGTIDVGDTPAGGATFTLRLPLGSSGAGAAEAATDAPAFRQAGRVLIVDDEPEVAQTLADILVNDGYQIDVVNSGEGAIEHLQSGDYSLVLSDIRMPSIDGIELYGKVKATWPELSERVIFVTGDFLNPSVVAFLDGTGRPRIEKPFIPSEVRQLVAATLGAAHAAKQRSGGDSLVGAGP